MKYWKIAENGNNDVFLIPRENGIWLTEQPNDDNLEELVNTNKLGSLRLLPYKDITKMKFNRTQSKMVIEFNDNDKSDLDIKLDPTKLEDINSYLASNMSGIKQKEMTMLQQIVGPFIGLVSVSGLTYLLYNVAINGSSGGRKKLILAILEQIASFLGPVGTLVVGGLFVALMLLSLIMTVRNPDQGNILVFEKRPELKL